MKRTTPRLAVFACLCLLCTSNLVAEPADKKYLILNAAVSEPLSNDAQSGYLDRLVGSALLRLGYRLETVRLPAERALILANDGYDDGELLRVAGLQKIYPNLIQVPENLIELEFVAFTGNPSLQINSWQDLAGLHVAIITGWKILEQHIPPATKLATVKNVDQLFTLLMKDRADAILYSRWSGLAHIRKHGLQGIKIVNLPLEPQSMYVYLHKRHHDLVPQLASELRALKAEGVDQRLFRELLAPYAGD